MSAVNPMSSKLEADYVEMINSHLDRIPVRQKEDYKIVFVALKLLQANQRLPMLDSNAPREAALRLHYEWLSLPEKPVSHKNNWLDSTPSWNDSPEVDLFESLHGLEELLTNSELFCEKKYIKQYKAIVLRRVASKIDEIEKMTLSDVKELLKNRELEKVALQKNQEILKRASCQIERTVHQSVDRCLLSLSFIDEEPGPRKLISRAFEMALDKIVRNVINRLGINTIPIYRHIGDGTSLVKQALQMLGGDAYSKGWLKRPDENGFSVIISFRERTYYVTANLREDIHRKSHFNKYDMAYWDGTEMVYSTPSRFKVKHREGDLDIHDILELMTPSILDLI